MTEGVIPDKDHISRYCAPWTCPGGKLQATSFLLRSIDEGLSVNWLEYFECSNRDDEIAEIQKVLSEKFSRVSATAQIAVLNVGKVCHHVKIQSLDNRVLKVRREPEPDDPSHSGIHNMRPDNELIAELILETVSESEIYPARA